MKSLQYGVLRTNKQEKDPLNKERIFVSYVMIKRWNQRAI